MDWSPPVKWTAQSEMPDERLSRLRREEAEKQSLLRREEAEAQSKLNEEKAENNARRRTQLIALCVVLGMILVLFSLCLWVIFSKQYTADIEKWATVILSSILSGSIASMLGYAIGKSTSK